MPCAHCANTAEDEKVGGRGTRPIRLSNRRTLAAEVLANLGGAELGLQLKRGRSSARDTLKGKLACLRLWCVSLRLLCVTLGCLGLALRVVGWLWLLIATGYGSRGCVCGR
jgi:hypothetical protein